MMVLVRCALVCINAQINSQDISTLPRIYPSLVILAQGFAERDKEKEKKSESRYNGCPYCVVIYTVFFAS